MPKSKPESLTFTNAHREAYAPGISPMINYIDGLAQKIPTDSLHRTIINSARSIANYFPDYSLLYNTISHRNLKILTEKNLMPYRDYAAKPILEMLASGEMKTAKLFDLKRAYSVEEVSFEHAESVMNRIRGNDFINSLNMPGVTTSELVGIGKLGQGKYANFFMIETSNFTGTFTGKMMQIGKTLDLAERALGMEELAITAYHTGKTNANIASKGMLVQPSEVAMPKVIKEVNDNLRYHTLCSAKFLRDLGMDLPKKAFKIDSKVNDFSSNPGSLSFGFGRIRGSDLGITPSNRLGIINAESVTESFDGLLRPLKHPLEQHSAFIKMVREEGIAHKLSLNEINKVITAYDKGFNQQIGGSITHEAKIIHETSALLDTIATTAYRVAVKSEKVELLEHFIGDLKQIL